MFFFFKQKTAYEVRISDWSSDVCSSDLRKPRAPGRVQPPKPRHRRADSPRSAGSPRRRGPASRRRGGRGSAAGRRAPPAPRRSAAHPIEFARSEEHTSELQSLMRISYAVFCLKKKNKKTKISEYSKHTLNNHKI